MEDIIKGSANGFPAITSSIVCNIFRDPEIFPRIGVEYQANVPSLIPGSHDLQLGRKKSYSRITLNKQYIRVQADNAKEAAGSINHQPTLASEGMYAALISSQERRASSQTKDWTTTECSCFLLGLYLFGKNLMVVSKFVESKNTGDILAYYYGKFYKSSDYQRWSGTRKPKSRQYVHGQRILTGWKQREFLSRLFFHVSEECHMQLTEISTSFTEGKLSMEEYAFSLRNIVGTDLLVEAIAIGKGKKDLTRAAAMPTKANRSIPLLAGVSSGKEISSLTSSEIIKFLSGDFRLSKARSNDLFWEAVWPRLLAGGWHSEQRGDLAYTGPNYSLVFIIPGIGKFSRKLVRGSQYFDSITDVLKKVASEPHLLDFDNETVEDGSKMKDDELALQIEKESEGLSNHNCHTYLRPPISTGSPDLLKFTVVDTSLLSESGRMSMRELMFLPPHPLSTWIEPTCSKKENEIPDLPKEGTEPASCSDTADCELNYFNKQLPTNSATENHHDRSSTSPTGWKSRMTVKFQFSRRLKKHKLNHSVPIADEQNLTSCGNESSRNDAENITTDANSNGQGSSCLENILVTEPHLDSSSNTVIPGTMEESREISDSKNIPGTKASTEKSHHDIMAGLDSTQVPTDSHRIGEFSHVITNSITSSADKSFLHSEGTRQSKLLVTKNSVPVEKQPVVVGRRQSMRNKPSTKGLEAIAYGFLGTKNKRKSTEDISRDEPSRCLHDKSCRFEYSE